MSHYVYIVKCADGTLYTGYSKDVTKRVDAHNSPNRGARYTRTRQPVTLVYSEIFKTKQEAMKREYEIKRMTRQNKIQLCKRSKL